jgi:hypothetical protein
VKTLQAQQRFDLQGLVQDLPAERPWLEPSSPATGLPFQRSCCKDEQL